jgi:hypothetical protein
MRLLAALGLTALVLPAGAAASELIARKATQVKLQVSPNGAKALLSYRSNGRQWYVLASGAINAKPPTPHGRQVAFKIKRSTTRPPFKGSCPPARLKVKLPYVLAACTAAKSHWAAQEWRTSLPNFGAVPRGINGQPRLHLAHWSGGVAALTLEAGWSHGGKWRNVHGGLTYRGRPVYGFGTTRLGVPTDSFGRLVYLDTLDSAYGRGWRRENSFVTRNPTGAYDYSLTPHRRGLTGEGSQYRVTVIGPGVTPDVQAQVADPGPPPGFRRRA